MPKIVITAFDRDRLTELLKKKRPQDAYDRALGEELAKAEVVTPKKIPADRITMNSQVQFVDENGKKREYWLVFPEDADVTANKISILSPVGCALLGCRVGDEVTVPTPNCDKKLKVSKVLSQPEREGNFDL